MSLAAGAVLAAGRAEPPTPPRLPDTPAVALADKPGEKPGPRKADAPVVWVGTPKLVRKEDFRLKEPLWAAWNPDGTYLVVCGAVPAEERPGELGGEKWRAEVLVLPVADRRLHPQGVGLPAASWPVGFTGGGYLLTCTGETGLISRSDTLRVWAVSAVGAADDRQVKLTVVQSFDLPDGVTEFAPFGPSAVRLLVAEHTSDGIVRAEVGGLDIRDGAAVVYTPQAPNDPGKGRGPSLPVSPRLTIWDTSTGRVVRTWRGSASALAFHPTRPVLAVLEPHGTEARLGLWDFTAQP